MPHCFRLLLSAVDSHAIISLLMLFLLPESWLLFVDTTLEYLHTVIKPVAELSFWPYCRHDPRSTLFVALGHLFAN